MPYLVRMISLAKWDGYQLSDDVDADAITSCMRTTKNTLSVWYVNSDSDQELEKVVLALASLRESIDKMEIVLIDCEDINKYDLDIIDTDGNSHIDSVNKSHKDICGLKYSTLEHVKNTILHSLRNNKRRGFSKKQIKEILLKAVYFDGTLDLNRIHKKLRTEIEIFNPNQRNNPSIC